MTQRMKRSLYIAAGVCLCGSLYIVYHLLIWIFFTDISLESIRPEYNPEFTIKGYAHRHPVTLISYADGPEVFYQNQNFQVLSALNRGVDQFILYRRHMIDAAFYEKNKEILTGGYGAGYWLWKPQIILQTMKNMPKDSIIIYMDSGLSVYRNLGKVFKALESHDVLIAQDGAKSPSPHLDEIVTPETMKALGVSLKPGEHITPLWAAFVAVKNTPRAREFIERWISFCEQKKLIEGRFNDQAILGLLAYKFPDGVITMPEPDVSSFLVWHYRKTDPQQQIRSLLPELHKHPKSIQRIMMNSSMMCHIRQFVLKHMYTHQRQKMNR